MTTYLRIILVSVATIATIAPTTRAGFILEFGRSQYLAAPRSNVEVDLYLVETPGSNVLATDGLITALTRISFNEGPFAVDPAQAVAVAINPGFDLSGSTDIAPATGTAPGTIDIRPAALIAPVTAPAAMPDRILLATITFVAGAASGDVTSLRAGLLETDPTFQNFVTGGDPAIGLDQDLRFGSSFIATIPEPGSLALLAIALPPALLAVLHRRRRHGRV